jgi:hypothetical protein
VSARQALEHLEVMAQNTRRIETGVFEASGWPKYRTAALDPVVILDSPVGDKAVAETIENVARLTGITLNQGDQQDSRFDWSRLTGDRRMSSGSRAPNETRRGGAPEPDTPSCLVLGCGQAWVRRRPSQRQHW